MHTLTAPGSDSQWRMPGRVFCAAGPQATHRQADQTLLAGLTAALSAAQGLLVGQGIQGAQAHERAR